MNTNGIRPGFQSVTPYLQVAGARKLMEFAKAAFGAEEAACHEDGGRIAHAELRIGNSIVELGEARTEYPAMPVALHYYVADVDAVYAKALEAGATSIMAPADHPYGERGAGVKDPCGNSWYLATWLG
jgi:PhnB protein